MKTLNERRLRLIVLEEVERIKQSHELPKKLPTYPDDHRPAVIVPKGGSSCASCRFLTQEGTCGNEHYVAYYGSGELGAEPDEFCSDWWEPIK